MSDSYYVPLGDYLSALWPPGILDPSQLGAIGGVWIEPPFTSTSPSFQMRTALVVEQHLAFEIPGIDDLRVLVASHSDDSTVMLELDTEPAAVVRIKDTPIILQVPAHVLRPAERKIDSSGSEVIVATPNVEALEITLAKVTLSAFFDGNVAIDTQGAFDLPLCLIGDTGVAIEASGVKFAGGWESPPKGKPQGWRGLYFETADVFLPGQLASKAGKIGMRDAYLGNGGFSGKVENAWTPVPLKANLFGADVELSSVMLEFVQNSLKETVIHSRIMLPFFDDWVSVELGLNLDGGFSLKLATAELGKTLTKDGVLELTLDSLGFEVKDGDFAVNLSGKLRPLVGIGDQTLDWPEVRIKQMTIHGDGRVDLDGGWLDLPEQYHLNLFGFPTELTQIGFGQTDAPEDEIERWIGFSGKIKLVDSLGLSAEFDGLRVLWHKHGDLRPRLTLEGAGVSLKIPDVMSIEGKVRLIGTDTQQGFKGAVKLRLDAAKLDLDAELLCIKVTEPGTSLSYTAFYVFVNGEFPAGIPLGATNVAFYGFAGLVGQNVAPLWEPAKEPNPPGESDQPKGWYEGWYKPSPTGVSDQGKWVAKQGNMALGAGITLGTASDDGHAINGKVLLVLLFPGPVMLLEGRANILADRKRLADPASEPTFAALAVLDSRAGYFQLNVAMKYLKPPPEDPNKGKIIVIDASADAYFDFHRGDAWHVYLGQNEPKEKRIRAQVVSIFRAESYFMLTARSLRMGFWVGYQRSFNFKPLRVGLDAWIAADATVSWKPSHLQGQLQLHGGVELKAFGRGIDLQVDALLKGDTPTPYLVTGEFKVKLNLPWPLPDPKATVKLEWKDPPAAPLYPMVIGSVSAEHLRVSEKWALDRVPRLDYTALDYASAVKGFVTGVDDPEKEAQVFGATYDEDRVATALRGAPLVPLDAHPVLSFAKSVRDKTGFGQVNAGPPAASERVGAYKFEYELVRLELYKSPLHASTRDWKRVAMRPGGKDDQPELLGGTWQLVSSGNDVLPNAKLILGSRSTSEWTREQSGPMYWGWLQRHLPEAACPPQPEPPVVRCLDWDDLDAGTFCDPGFVKDDLVFDPRPRTSVVYRPLAALGKLRALEVKGELIVGGFPYGTTQVALCFDMAGGASVLARAFHGSEQVSTGSAFGDDVSVPRPLTLKAPAPDKWIDQVVISCQTVAYLYCICYVAPLNPDRKEAFDSWKTSVGTTRDAWWKTDPVFEPDQNYKLVVITKVKRSKKGAKEPDREFSEAIYFKTGQPPGVIDPADAVTPDRELTVPDPSNRHEHFPVKGPLKDLAPYVEYTVPAPGTRAVYRAYDIGANFNEGYIEHMYALADKLLGVEVVDNAGVAVAFIKKNAWGKNPTRILRRSETEWLYGQARATTAGCLTKLEKKALPPHEQVMAYGPVQLLRPETRYEARLVAHAIKPSGIDKPTDYVVHRWPFITSKFAHFRHHIGSFGDRVRVKSISREQRDTLGPIAYGAWPPDQPSPFDRIAGQIRGNDPEPWPGAAPVALELTALNVEGRCCGLLLRSPEPLDQDRVLIGSGPEGNIHPVLHMGAWVPAPALAGAAKLVAARLATSEASAEDEWVDLIMLGKAETDMSGWRITFSHNQFEDPPEWTKQEFYVFPPKSALNEGSLVRVHSGMEPAGPQLADNYLHVYAGRTGPVLNGSGDRLALVDTSGKVVHARSFLAPDNYKLGVFETIWNADRTAAFLFMQEGMNGLDDWPEGAYRLPCAFLRYLASDPLAPVLKQNLDASPETIDLEFVVGGKSRVFLPSVRKLPPRSTDDGSPVPPVPQGASLSPSINLAHPSP